MSELIRLPGTLVSLYGIGWRDFAPIMACIHIALAAFFGWLHDVTASSRPIPSECVEREGVTSSGVGYRIIADECSTR